MPLISRAKVLISSSASRTGSRCDKSPRMICVATAEIAPACARMRRPIQKPPPRPSSRVNTTAKAMSADHEILDVLPLLNVVPHQHPIAARQRETLCPHFVFAGFIAERNRDLELDPLSFIGIDFRPRRNVARHRAQLRVHHQIHGAANVLVLRALFDQLDEIAARQHQDLLAQALDFRSDEIVGAAVDDARDGEVDGAQERGRAAREHDRINDGDAERRGVEHPEEPVSRDTLIGADGSPSRDTHYSSSRKLYPAPRTVCSRGLSKSLSIAWRRRLMCTSMTLVWGSK